MPVSAAQLNVAQKNAISVKFVWRDNHRECYIDVEQTATTDEIKELVKEQWEIDPLEQLLMFRGVVFRGSDLPLGDPKLVEKSGDNIEIWIMHQPLRYKMFCKAERFKTLNEKNKHGCTVLHKACVKAEIGVVEELLAKKGFKEVNAVDKAKMTALHRALLCQFIEISMLLLESPRFTALNQSDRDKRTALHHAAIWGNADICKAIIARSEFKSKSHRQRDVFDRTALEYAEERGLDEAAEVLRAAMPELPPEDEEKPGTAETEQTSEDPSRPVTTAASEGQMTAAMEGEDDCENAAEQEDEDE